MIPPRRDILAKAEQGLSADVLVLLLSEASWPDRWPRERWEPVLFDGARSTGAEVVTVLLEDCPFPPLLRRRNFVDASANRVAGMRVLKRWIWQREQGALQALSPTISGDLEYLYAGLSDQAGAFSVSGAEATRFVREASQEFEAVLWVPCHGCTLAEIAGELGCQLGLTLEGTVEENCRRIDDLLAARRCLVVLDAPARELAETLVFRGRTSVLTTRDPVTVVETPVSLAQARKLVTSRRYAEAYEMLYRLMNAGTSPADCARELSWICEQWGRIGEAESLRSHYRLPPREQLSLFADWTA